VFALGCVLFECLTGVPPFEGDTTAAVLAKILFGPSPRVSQLWPDVPEILDTLVAQMLAKDPALRPSDGTNLVAALAVLGPLMHSVAAMSGARAVEDTDVDRRRAAASGRSDAGQRRAERPADRGRAGARGPAYGGHLEQLADGSTVAVLAADRQVATDQAAQAARCALAMGAFANGRPMAIAMGRADATSKLPEGDVIRSCPRGCSPTRPRAQATCRRSRSTR